ncbi:MAG: zf-HC2 domain-containing protein [Verrucomicrobiota bacterium]|jgi:anti-sigma factor RsiW
MNCGDFQNRLYEYVEGTLLANEQATAEQHLAGCAACQRAARQEQAMALNLSARLHQRAEGLSLDPERRRTILAEARSPVASPGSCASLAALWNRFAMPAGIAIALAAVAFIVSSHFSGPARRGAAIERAEVHNSQHTVSIQLSAQVPTLRFRRNGDQVVDTLVYETVVASGTLPTGN